MPDVRVMVLQPARRVPSLTDRRTEGSRRRRTEDLQERDPLRMGWRGGDGGRGKVARVQHQRVRTWCSAHPAQHGPERSLA